MSEYYYRSGPNEFGPLTSSELRRLVQAGRLVADDQIRKGRHGKWLPALKLPGLFSVTERHDEPAINEMDFVIESAGPHISVPRPSDESDRETAIDSSADSGEVIAGRVPQAASRRDRRAAEDDDPLLVKSASAVAAICYFAAAAGLALGVIGLFSDQGLLNQIFSAVWFVFALVGLAGGCCIRLLLTMRQNGR
jgi:hypothetical protein